MTWTPLFERLPALYRTRDTDPAGAGQFEAFIGLMDEILQGIDADIDQLYHDQFIETCADWMVPYIGDLLGVTPLKGDPFTIRADTARTVALRRRRGTLGAMESLAFNLTGWAAHAVELRERLVWTQHLNHQRPDRGGIPPLALPHHIADPVRHGTVTLRDPGVLSFLGSAFDGFARTADLKPTRGIHARPNLPNMALFLWRLRDFLVPVTRPVHVETVAQTTPGPGDAPFAARYVVEPLGRPLRLFNTFRYDPGAEPPDFSVPDRTPGPMPAARLQDGPPTGNAAEYVAVDIFDGSRPDDPGDAAVGLTLHLPASAFAGTAWTTRGANLCAWEQGLATPLREREIVIDPVRGRVLLGIADDTTEGAALRNRLRISFAYAAPGPVGAHPVARSFPDTIWPDLGTPEVIAVTAHPGGTGLRAALSGLATAGPPRIIEITDSMTHRVNLAAVDDIVDEDGPTLTLARPFWIRARTGQRPVIEFRQPLRMRPADPADQGLVRALDIRIDGAVLTLRNAPVAEAIVARAAVNALAFHGVTLDPGGHLVLDGTADGTRAAPQPALHLAPDLGFAVAADLEAFEELPEVTLVRSVAGPIAMGPRYRLTLKDSIVDGGTGRAIAATQDPDTGFGPILAIDGATILGPVRVRAASGQGGLFRDRLEVRDHQSGCLSYGYFSGDMDRLPPHFACVFGSRTALAFTSITHHQPGYCQLHRIRTARQVLEDGPGADEIGAYGFLLNTHKWKNLNIRLREFTPVGVRPILATVT
ncbi:hypothetical protein [Rhodovulum euryhalinum]|uniref:Tail protein P2 I n=1 Tax=Rhodovulum euryhalinum TaxID=35805 RepID=A0A4R2KHW8_9RHOB|nr:hypothetical protein [Rhodovulum euryhalinum]TCO70106.1 hypothetical protein EV655_11148 [Rhodovulum euryhalinum]